MPIAQRAITEIQEADDFLGTPSDGQVLIWSVAANAFVPANLAINSIFGLESLPAYDAGVLKLKGSTHNDDRLEFGVDDTLGNGNWLQSFRRGSPNLLRLQPLGGGLSSAGVGTGLFNEIYGNGAGVALTTGGTNTFLGYQVGKLVNSGSANSIFGGMAAPVLTSGQQNTIIGSQAGNNLISGTGCTYIGEGSGGLSGSDNQSTCIGVQALASGSGPCLAIGASAQAGTTAIAIGYNAQAATGSIRIGFEGSTSGSSIHFGQGNVTATRCVVFQTANADAAIPTGSCLYYGVDIANPYFLLSRWSSTNTQRPVSGISASWGEPADASRLGRLTLDVYDFNGKKSGLQIDTDGTNVSLNALGSLKSQLPVYPNTAVAASPNLISLDQSGSFFTNEGSIAQNYHTLPNAQVNLHYTFIVREAVGMRINLQPGQTIRVGASVSSAGGFIQSSTQGSTIHLVAINATEWYAEGMQGTWGLS